MPRKLAEVVVAAVVVVWLVAFMVAVVSPERGDVLTAVAPIMGTVSGGAIAALVVSRSRNGKNGNGRV